MHVTYTVKSSHGKLYLGRMVPSAIREVKHDVYRRRQTAKMKLWPSVFSSLYSSIKIFAFAVNSKGHFSFFFPRVT